MADQINNPTEEELFNMSDEEAEAAFMQARSQIDIDEQINDENIESQDETGDTSTGSDTADKLEQSEAQESDDNASDNKNETETNDEDSTETKVEDTAVNTEVKDEKTEDEVKVEDEKSQPKQEKMKFRADNKDFEFTQEEIMERFPQVFGQAMNYTRKTQAMKPWRKQIDALEQNNVKPEDLNLMIDVLKGNKDAVAEMLKRTGVDALELDTEDAEDYVPQDYGRDDNMLDLQEVLTEIGRDPEYEKTKNVLANEWDDTSWNTLSATPEKVKALHMDVKSGLYDTLMPTVAKLKLYDGAQKSDLEYYGEAAALYYGEQESLRVAEATNNAKQALVQRQQEEQARIDAVKAREAQDAIELEKIKQRDAAAPVNQGGVKTTVDYLDDSDEAFEAWYNKVQQA